MLPSEYLDLLDAPLTGVLASIGPDGMPHASPVWFTHDGEHLLVSTTNDRQKFRNLRDRPIAAFTLVDPDQSLRYLEVRADVEIVLDVTNELRDRIAAIYGVDAASFDPPGTTRVILRLTPRQVIRH
jgi:PPOX class probable F420-dependent enzyme